VKKRVGLLLVCAMVLMPSVTVGASNYGLNGLTGVRIIVEDLDDDLKDFLSTARVEKDVSLRLRREGIEICASSDYSCPSYFYVAVTSILLRDNSFVYKVRVALCEAVTNPRGSTVYGAEVWNKSTVGIVSDDDVRSTIRETVNDKTDLFLDQYLEENPVTR
jgi:hypothetical protein